MNLSDRWTDEAIEELEDRIRSEYEAAGRDIARMIDDYYNGKVFERDGDLIRGRSLADKDKYFRSLVESGERTEDDYKIWRMNQLGRGKRYEAMRDKVTKRMTDANFVANDYINGQTASVYALNRNYSAFQIEQSVGAADFTLMDESTVRRLLRDDPSTMPYYPKERALERGIDLEYGRDQIRKSITAGIMQGRSVSGIASDLRDRVTGMSYTSSVRAARTAMTGAQNAGRMDSYHEAEKLGIKMKKEWIATLDNRTRHTHQMLDGKTVGVDEDFVVEGMKIKFPGDTSAPGELVYNCRCTLASVIDKHSYSGERIAKDPKTGEYEKIADMNYQQWAESKGLKTARPEPEPEPTPARELFTFTPAETLKEAEEYINQYVDKNQFGALGVDYTGVSLEVANEVNRTIGEFYHDFNVAGKFGGIVAPAGNTKLGKMMSNATAAYAPIRNSFILNRKSMKDMTTFAKAMKTERDAIKNILGHPERYDFSKLSRAVREVIERSKVSGRSTMPQTLADVLHHELGHMMEKQVKASELWPEVKAGRSTYADMISGYAGQDDSEYIAESLASYLAGEDVIDPLMKKIFEGLRK